MGPSLYGGGRRASGHVIFAGALGAIVAAAAVWTAASAPSASGASKPLSPSAAFAAARPNHYIKNWDKRVVECPKFTHRPWVFWKTYATATIGDRLRAGLFDQGRPDRSQHRTDGATALRCRAGVG
jgi:hypothetical protein